MGGFYILSHKCCRNKWKNNYKQKLNVYESKYISLPGQFRPLIPNIDASLAYTLNTSNEFKARPLKHWRKQYGQYNNRQSFSNKTSMQNFNSPGGYSISTTTSSNKDTPPPCDCSGRVLGYPDYLINKDNSTYVCTTSGDSYDFATCKDISNCIANDIPSIAKKRSRYSYSNNNSCSDKSYASYHEYNYARCNTYDQNISTNCPYGCGKGEIDNSCNCGCSLSEITYKNAYCKNKAIVKPNNPKFHQQGAVSSSSRLLRLKLNTINSNANSIGSAYGSESTNALIYNGRPEAPFINKSKINAGGFAINRKNGQRYPVDRSLYYRYNYGKKLQNGQTMCNSNSNNKECL